MATVSFEKSFVVEDAKSIELIKQNSLNPRIVHVKKRNYKEENVRGIKLVLQQLSNSKNY